LVVPFLLSPAKHPRKRLLTRVCAAPPVRPRASRSPQFIAQQDASAEASGFPVPQHDAAMAATNAIAPAPAAAGAATR
jgi:hypothetical protein